MSDSPVPVLLKGVQTGEDARLAAEHGAAGIVVSNHGGRQLDTVAATIDLLPECVEAVDGRIEVLVDGGIRRGTDVLVALALGARAVLVGPPGAVGTRGRAASRAPAMCSRSCAPRSSSGSCCSAPRDPRRSCGRMSAVKPDASRRPMST